MQLNEWEVWKTRLINNRLIIGSFVIQKKYKYNYWFQLIMMRLIRLLFRLLQLKHISVRTQIKL